MRTTLTRWMLCTGIGLLLLGGSRLAATPTTALDDAQLSDIYAAGFDVQMDFDIDLAAQNPNGLLVQGGSLDALRDYANQRLSNASSEVSNALSSGGRFDANGTYMPSLPSITNNTLNMSDNAMQNARTLLNVIALNGDVAVGMNMNIIVNPGDTPFTVTQTNINWSILSSLSDLFPTPSTSSSQ